MDKQQTQFIQLIQLLKQIEIQVNFRNDDILQTIASHKNSLQKLFQRAIRFICTFHSQNRDTFLITLKLLQAVFDNMGAVLSSVEDGVGNLMQDSGEKMCNPMMEYVKGLKDNIRRGTCARLLVTVKEMERAIQNGWIELETTRRKATIAEEKKMQALWKLKETEELLKRTKEHCGFLFNAKHESIEPLVPPEGHLIFWNLLEYNPHLARYSTFGVRNSPLHYSAAQGHHEIVYILLESGVDINLRNYRGQTALTQACQYGHWEVVQTLILFKANIYKVDCLNGGTALHLAALNGHSRCIRLLLADFIPSIPDCWNLLGEGPDSNESISEFDTDALYEVINKAADGGITALHMAALNGHVETVQLLLDLGASVSEITVEDGTTIDLIGAGSTPLHYAACGGNAQCCQILIARGASLTAENANGWNPLMVARSWHRELEGILSTQSEQQFHVLPSPYICLPLMSIVTIARECGWRNSDNLPTCQDPCVVCLERKCTVSAEGCEHEFCTQCALYLCSTNRTSSAAQGPPGSIACPLCRHGIISFVKLKGTRPLVKEITRTTLSLSFCSCAGEVSEPTSLTTPLCKPESHCTRISPFGSSFRSLSCQKFPTMKMNASLCMGPPNTRPSLVPCDVERNLISHLATRCSRSSFRRSVSHGEGRRSWFALLNQYVTTGGGGGC